MRRTYLAPQSLYGQYVISRGAMSWDVDPKNKRVIVTENSSADDEVVRSADVALLAANYRAVIAGTETIADRRATIVDLMNRYTGERIMRLWLDDRTQIVLGKEAYHGDGSLAWRTRYDAIRFTNNIPPQLFTADLPRGYKTLKGRSYGHPSEDLTRAIAECGFAPIGPKYLPEGFAVMTADLSQIKGVKNLHLIYSDGIRTVSLFENATDRAVDFGGLRPRSTSFEGHSAHYVHDGPTTLLAWREHGLEFALVGDLDLKDLVRIATSVVP
jgi:negative regulator of sigma E activity